MQTTIETDVAQTRLLLIEDEPGDVALVRAHLEDVSELRAFRLETAGSLAEVLEGSHEADVVLLDLNLPDGRGEEAFRRVADRFAGTPIVVLTGREDRATGVSALRWGAQDYLRKRDLSGELLARSLLYAIERFRLVAEGEQHLRSLNGQLERVNERLRRSVYYDHLTNLLNRRGLERALQRELKWLTRHGDALAVLLIDLDDFKRVNDSYGHAVGDVVLQDVAEKIRRTIRETDYAARVGGDEFLVLLPDTTLTGAGQVAEKLRLVLGQPSLEALEDVRVTASIGIARATDSTSSLEDFLVRTHKSLSLSKKRGKNRITADGTSTEQLPRSAVLIEQLLRGDALYAVTHPIVRLQDEQTVGCELLARSRLHAFERPDHFFRAAYEHQRLTKLDLACLRMCLAAEAGPAGRLHVNVLPTTLIEVRYERLLSLLPEGDPRRVWFEISEQQILGDPRHLVDAVRGLRGAGVRVAIDDVGFGRSCLEGLLILEPDAIKIDRSWVTGAAGDGGRLRNLERLVSVARALGCEIVAEGIETRDDLGVLLELGVELGQGYLWGEPRPLSEA